MGDVDVPSTECPICLERMKDPVISKTCGHSACDICFTQLIDKSKCPICRTGPLDTIPNYGLRNAIAEIARLEMKIVAVAPVTNPLRGGGAVSSAQDILRAKQMSKASSTQGELPSALEPHVQEGNRTTTVEEVEERADTAIQGDVSLRADSILIDNCCEYILELILNLPRIQKIIWNLPTLCWNMCTSIYNASINLGSFIRTTSTNIYETVCSDVNACVRAISRTKKRIYQATLEAYECCRDKLRLCSNMFETFMKFLFHDTWIGQICIVMYICLSKSSIHTWIFDLLYGLCILFKYAFTIFITIFMDASILLWQIFKGIAGTTIYVLYHLTVDIFSFLIFVLF